MDDVCPPNVHRRILADLIGNAGDAYVRTVEGWRADPCPETSKAMQSAARRLDSVMEEVAAASGEVEKPSQFEINGDRAKAGSW